MTIFITEAEYISLLEVGKLIVWAIKWMKGLRFMAINGDLITLLGDNKGSLALMKNSEYH